MEELIFEKISNSEAQTEEIAGEFARLLPKDGFVQLSGEPGAGKTAFVRGMGRYLCPGAAVRSPTYTVMRDYPCVSGGRFYHFDLYRIFTDEDLESVGFYDCAGLIAAEWCENVPFALPRRRYLVRIDKGEAEYCRRIVATLIDESR
ncbi:MAG: tRNA (adenosine(37)-N6)-threonylcarbamoyltransferase complex ATPase subunit type 1 TsaE [Clostridia bacterium]|nr:tRNA (adenosine(37)-N6)-threonylcarbamoyltransferase complex ATPase subunit type 1 TsaE [Clostridia bacterium]